MKKALLFLPLFMLFSAYTLFSQEVFESDIIKTSEGDLKITFIGHGTLMFTFKNLVIHIDPYSKAADYTKLAKADMILITHDHSDHLDAKALTPIKKNTTKMIMTQICFDKLKEGSVMKNGDTKTEFGITIEAVPAYNVVNKRPDGQAYHPKGNGNGYILTFGDKKIYIAGDTENIPEMKNIKNIYCAFLPMNLPYTMTPEMTADAAKTLNPKILYPYHFGDTDTNKLVALLKSEKNIEVRIRKMQ
jgi:L-ascorbate metabolism protein UlaG (beta-lactamase superfamily)